MLKRIGAGGLLGLTGVQSVSAAPAGGSDRMIRFGGDREDMRLADYDARSEDFGLDDCCFTPDCKCTCYCCLC